MKLGIVPAGGVAFRFGGVMKELLPIRDGETLLTRCVDAMSFCDATLVLTTPVKVQAHIEALAAFQNIVFAMSMPTLWDSIKLALKLDADRYYFAMPDTLFPSEALREDFTEPLAFGVFETYSPERFGVFVNGVICDKENVPGKAWGTVMWDRRVAEYWRGQSYQNHTDAWNDATRNFGYNIEQMDYYYDFASMQDWKEWLIVH